MPLTYLCGSPTCRINFAQENHLHLQVVQWCALLPCQMILKSNRRPLVICKSRKTVVLIQGVTPTQNYWLSRWSTTLSFWLPCYPPKHCETGFTADRAAASTPKNVSQWRPVTPTNKKWKQTEFTGKLLYGLSLENGNATLRCCYPALLQLSVAL